MTARTQCYSYKIIKIEKTNDEQIICNVCLENKQNIKFESCGHTDTCSECYSKLKQNTCPICRVEISHLIEINYSETNKTILETKKSGCILL
jgi:hypothetical protein